MIYEQMSRIERGTINSVSEAPSSRAEGSNILTRSDFWVRYKNASTAVTESFQAIRAENIVSEQGEMTVEEKRSQLFSISSSLTLEWEWERNSANTCG